MSWASIRQTIEQAVVAAGIVGSGQIAFDNVEFTPTPGTAWLRVSIRPTSRARETMTGNAATGQRRRGVVLAQAFVEAGKGAGAADALIDALDATLREATLAGEIVFNDGMEDLGHETEGSWYFQAASWSFEQDS